MGRLAHTREEFTHGKDKGDQVPCTEAELKAIFEKHDDNKDGKLSRSEVQAAFQELGSRWPWFRAKDGFRHADQDKNGYIDIKTELKLLVAYAANCNYIIRR
ncbi:hypothetical protein I3760_15G057000 [Carya illinoinensis]|uniref:EF-hand domain-containing protein n=1 Tax=Carya illinoinensis TaxID=32201 RepID=A0A8T1NC80_CARIL|nr:hypothetical protein I3760_15G057000 [Carya illinoinensis]KAG6626577.1 hypothetical protein CIPAW_15G059300 [Carya illinoinensis]KAG6674705.1 hypothetical protein I3842_15G057800 [Carya illinoinensis]